MKPQLSEEECMLTVIMALAPIIHLLPKRELTQNAAAIGPVAPTIDSIQ